MSKSKEAPVKVECMGGCGKYQMIRRSKMNQSLQFDEGRFDSQSSNVVLIARRSASLDLVKANSVLSA